MRDGGSCVGDWFLSGVKKGITKCGLFVFTMYMEQQNRSSHKFVFVCSSTTRAPSSSFHLVSLTVKPAHFLLNAQVVELAHKHIDFTCS